MSYEYRFDQSPSAVFDAVAAAVRQNEKLGPVDKNGWTVAFTTKASGWSWGSQWVIQLFADGDGTVATAAMRSAGSLVAGVSEKKKIDRIWTAAAAQLPQPATRNAPSSANHHAPSPSEAVTRVHGNLLADERFGGRRVRIFANGYIQISSLGPGAYQRLLRIEDDFVIQKKTGPGRAAAGVATLGTNFLLTGNKRGDLYLSIVTDAGAQTLRESPPTNDGVRRGTTLGMAGRTAIEQAAAQAAPLPAGASSTIGSTTQDSVEERLAKAKSLLDRGLITAEEYAATRSSILSDI